MERPSKLRIPYGFTAFTLEVKPENLIGVVRPRSPPSVNVKAEIGRALDSPLGSERLEMLARKAGRAIIVVDDYTRPLPSSRILPALLDRLEMGGIKDVTVMVATGIHRPPSNSELEALLGREVLKRTMVEVHNPDEDLTFVGTTRFGNKVYLNRSFVEADLRIVVSDISLHYFAGYGGGRKSVLPGLAGRTSITFNHRMAVLPGAEAGRLEGNPVHEDMAEAACMAGVDFALNVVLNLEGEIVKAFAGSLEEAFNAGVKVFDSLYRVKVSNPADIVVASPGGAPADINLLQSVKTLHMAVRLVKPGGVVVLVAECPEGYGSETFTEWMASHKASREVLESLEKGYELGGHAAYYTLKDVEHAHVILVSSLPGGEVREIFRMTPARSLDEALKEAYRIAGENAGVLVLPKGSSLLPVLSQQTETAL